MRSFGRESSLKQWARFALKCGLFLTDAKLWSALNDQLSDRVDDVGDSVRRTYARAADRFQDASDALHGHGHWAVPTASFLGGLGLGIGLGVLFAPAPGDEIRAAIRDRATEVRDRVADMSGGANRFRSTGTEGD
jgi:hypothetical protein